MIPSTFIAAVALHEIEDLAGELAGHNPFRAKQARNLTASLISLLEAAGAIPEPLPASASGSLVAA